MKHPPTANECRISEIFSSLQGEGTHLGERHIFVRFEECHIHCTYCDELDKVGKPYTQDKVVCEIQRLEKEFGPHSFVSLTGGEPLIYLIFLKPLIQRLKSLGFKIYLETDGILFQALQVVVDLCDVIAMDLKPASVTKEKSFLKEHRQFLEISKNRETFAKIVLSNEINPSEFMDLISIVQDVAPKTPVVLQPLSAAKEGHEDRELMDLIQTLQRKALMHIVDVRIVPRFHKILNIR